MCHPPVPQESALGVCQALSALSSLEPSRSQHCSLLLSGKGIRGFRAGRAAGPHPRPLGHVLPAPPWATRATRLNTDSVSLTGGRGPTRAKICLSGRLSQQRAGNHDYQEFILLPIERQLAKQERAPLGNSPGNLSAPRTDDAEASFSTLPPRETDHRQPPTEASLQSV